MTVQDEAPQDEQSVAVKPEEVAPPVKFVQKAMIHEASAIVQSILTMPDSFSMPGYFMVNIGEGEAALQCAPGMKFDEETGTFSEYIPPSEPSEEGAQSADDMSS